MVAVLTKYEALVDRVKDECGGRMVTKTDVLNYANKNVLEPLKGVMHSPVAIVQTHRESRFGILITIVTRHFQIKVKVVND